MSALSDTLGGAIPTEKEIVSLMLLPLDVVRALATASLSVIEPRIMRRLAGVVFSSSRSRSLDGVRRRTVISVLPDCSALRRSARPLPPVLPKIVRVEGVLVLDILKFQSREGRGGRFVETDSEMDLKLFSKD